MNESDSGKWSASGNENAKESESGRENETERGSAGGKKLLLRINEKISSLALVGNLTCVSVSGQDLEVETDTGTSLTKMTCSRWS